MNVVDCCVPFGILRWR